MAITAEIILKDLKKKDEIKNALRDVPLGSRFSDNEGQVTVRGCALTSFKDLVNL